MISAACWLDRLDACLGSQLPCCEHLNQIWTLQLGQLTAWQSPSRVHYHNRTPALQCIEVTRSSASNYQLFLGCSSLLL